MGLSASKFSTGGTLKGAFAPPLPNIKTPPKLDPAVKQYRLTVPDDKGAGDKMTVNIKGNMVTATIPAMYTTPDGGKRPIQPGDKFVFEWGDRDRVIASTLPALPGATIVEAKPILYANCSHSFFTAKYNDRKLLWCLWS